MHLVHVRLAMAMTARRIQQTELVEWESLPDGFLLTISEVAEILRCTSESHVRNAIKYGHLKALRLRGQGKGTYRIRKSQLVEYIEESEVAASTAGRKETSRPARGKPFKHIKPTWSHDASQQQADQSGRSGGRNARSRGGSSGQGGRR